jgi:hypothetical protein
MGAVLTGKSDVDWSQLQSSRRTGWIVSAIALLITCILCFLCYRLFWTSGGSSEFFVPDNIPLSITFFSAIILSTVGAQFLFSPSDGKKPG